MDWCLFDTTTEYLRNHHHHSLSFHCMTKASSNHLCSSVLAANLFQATPAKFPIPSLYLLLCLLYLLSSSLSCHSVTLFVHLLSVWQMMCPFFLKISSTLICSFIHDALFPTYIEHYSLHSL